MQRSLAAHEVASHPTSARLVLGAKGFRPFFLLSTAFASVAVPIWVLVVAGVVRPSTYLAPTLWHAHEMIFGFTVAVIAGFLLTAVGNWTQRETLVGKPLLALAGVWALGRVAIVLPPLIPPAAAAAVDLAFLPALVVVLARPIVAARNRRNLVMLVILGALFTANLVVHLDALGIAPAGAARRACLAAIDVIVLVALVISGRVFPMFTRNATGIQTIRSHATLDATTVTAMAGLTLLDLAFPESTVSAVASAAVGGLAIARAWGWRTRAVSRQPLLWVLHVGYAWVPLGLVLRLVAQVDSAVPRSLATHALTVGAIGTLTLGMMARVSLGHTGRPFVASRPMAGAFAAVSLAAGVRVLAPVAFPQRYLLELFVAAGLWTAAFLACFAILAPLLARPRADGKPG